MSERAPATTVRSRAALGTLLAAACATCGPSEPLPDPRALAAHRDGDGVFVLDDASVAGRAFAGPGVRCLTGTAGRVEPGAADPRVWLREADGTFDQRPLRFASSDVSLTDALRAAVVAHAGSREGSSWAALRAVAAGAPPREASSSAWQPSDSEEPADAPAAGAPLAAWLPATLPFVRFRSVESAYRFTEIADRIAARLLAAAGGGRDHGTLRMTLHDLALPEIWQANPETAKGVGECALTFVPRPGGGRLEAALVLRITDAETHRMQTDAGLSWNAMPEHRWAPADDPDPASRERRNFRRVVGDVEVVATSEALLRRIVAERRGRSVQDDDERRSRTPVADDAGFDAFQSETARTAWDPRWRIAAAIDIARRETVGWAHVLRGWTGLEPPGDGVAAPLPSLPDLSTTLGRLVAASATTDERGAHFELSFLDESSATAAASALEVCARPFAQGAAACSANRRDLAPLALAGREADLRERAFVVLGWRPECPCGGGYAAHPVTREVRCSVHGTDAAPLPDPKPPKALLRDLSRTGATVRFRVRYE